ncbi:uncharacterized protein [Parasteatoda tepidariorum]|uniref:uncharacterized protein n=1 Tax=Parasteatoda tepidariorum TaxID=114398 RepID=UPI00077F8AEE|nr:uncharacterized protein LOC107440844 [Parasteatoda tepidariorum]
MISVITATPYISGFFVSFVLLNATLCKGNTLIGINTTSATSIEQGEKKINMSSLPFSNHLSCHSTVTNRRRHQIMENQKNRYASEFYKYITSYANRYKGDTQHVLNEYAITDCTSLGLEILPGTPNLEELLELDVEAAVNQIYYSLQVHSAYIYLIHHQYKEDSPRCPGTLPREKQLAAQSLILANKQKSLVCTIETSMSLLGYNRNATYSILELEVTDLSQCSHMAIRDCQVLRSIIHLLNTMARYSQTQTL